MHYALRLEGQIRMQMLTVPVLQLRAHMKAVAASVQTNMETYPIIDKVKSDSPFAFEIENAYVDPGTIAGLLQAANGVTDVQARKLFGKSNDIHIEFKYLNRDYVVLEPYGDNSRYWIGPKNPEDRVGDIANLENVLKQY